MFLASRPHYSCHHHRDTRFSSGILPFENRLLCCKGLPGLLLWWHPRLWRLNQIPSNHPLFFLIVYLGACCFLTECMYQRVKPYNFRIDICICLGGLTERFMVCVCLFWFFFFSSPNFLPKMWLVCSHICQSFTEVRDFTYICSFINIKTLSDWWISVHLLTWNSTSMFLLLRTSLHTLRNDQWV